jgi:type I restriction enzyme S subunit
MRYKLGEICEIVSGSTPKSGVPDYWDGDIKWITPAELDEDSYIINDSVRKITELGVRKTGLTAFPAGTVILSSRAPIGKVAIAGCEMYCNQGFKNLICSEKINNRYLYWYLKGNTEYLNSLGRGATFKEISKQIVASIEINVPDIKEQEDAVRILEKISTLMGLRKRELKLLDELIKARFVEMFGDFKTNPRGWHIMGFEEIATIDGNMTTDYEKYANYPHIGIDSIEKETGLLKGYRTVAEDGVISGKYVFTPAHIIYSKIRPNLNKVALPDFDGLCSADAYPILPIEGKCNRVFLAYDMRSKFFLDYILQFCNRTNLPKVNRKEVAGFRTPLPPIELQNEFAAFVSQVDKSKLLKNNYRKDNNIKTIIQ